MYVARYLGSLLFILGRVFSKSAAGIPACIERSGKKKVYVAAALCLVVVLYTLPEPCTKLEGGMWRRY